MRRSRTKDDWFTPPETLSLLPGRWLFLFLCLTWISPGAIAAPTAVDDAYTVDENSSSNNFSTVLTNDSAGAGGNLTIVAAGTSGTGSVEIDTSAESVIYTPATGFVGTETIYYVVLEDSDNETATANIVITVNELNTAPAAVADTATVDEDSGTTLISVLANDSDPDADNISLTSVTNPSQGGTASISGNQISYTPATNFNGTETFSYTISDDATGALTDTAEVSVTVNSVNDTPLAADDTDTVAEDVSSRTVNVLANDTDVDGDSLSITDVSSPSQGGTVTIVSNKLVYVPAANFVGTESVTYTVSDGVDTDTATLVVTVTAVNDSPVGVGDVFTVTEDAAAMLLNVLANDTDVDEDNLSITAVTAPNNGGTAVISGTQISYRPAADFSGEETFNYSVSDGLRTVSQVGVTVTVTAVNDPPVAADDIKTVPEDTTDPVSISVLANDTDADPTDTLTIVAITEPDNGGSASVSGDEILYTPAPNFDGTETISYIVSDGNGGVDTGTLTVTVSNENDGPTAQDDVFTVAEDSVEVTLDVLANDTDPENDAIKISAVGVPDNGGSVSIAGDSLTLTYTPSTNFSGTETFTYQATDGTTPSEDHTVTITVTNQNDGPEPPATTVEIATDANQSVSINVLGYHTDPDTPTGDSLSLDSVGSPANGTTVIDGDLITYTPDADFSGTDQFSYIVRDQNDATLTGTVYVSVKGATVNTACASGATSTADLTAGCKLASSSTSITVYGFGLCSSEPAAPSTTPMDISTCQLLYDGLSTGAEIVLGAAGTTQTFPTFEVPAHGTYTHGVVILSNTLTTTPTIEIDGTTVSSGTGQSLTTTMQTFDSSNLYSVTYPSQEVWLYLADSGADYRLSTGSADRIVAIQRLPTPQTMNELTRSIYLGFSVSEAISYDDATSSTAVAPLKIRFRLD